MTDDPLSDEEWTAFAKAIGLVPDEDPTSERGWKLDPVRARELANTAPKLVVTKPTLIRVFSPNSLTGEWLLIIPGSVHGEAEEAG